MRTAAPGNLGLRQPVQAPLLLGVSTPAAPAQIAVIPSDTLGQDPDVPRNHRAALDMCSFSLL